MSGRVVSDIQTRAEGASLYIRYNTDANVVNSESRRQRKMPGKKFVQPLRQRKKFVQANSKVQIDLKKNSCRG
jgi:hypothetical protein